MVSGGAREGEDMFEDMKIEPELVFADPDLRPVADSGL